MSNRPVETQQTKTIRIVLNGEPREVPEGLTVHTLLMFLQVDPSRVAVELDREIVRKQDWAGAPIPDGSQIEVVWFVGGG